MRNELYHFGILGMKWGVRRYQNPDGSYTAEGLARHKKKESKQSARKKAARMTNDELRKANDRKRLEQEYVRLNSSSILDGKNFLENTLLVVGTAIATDLIKNHSTDIAKTGGKFIKKFGSKAIALAKAAR